MQDDLLLTQYAQNGSEAAFSQIIARHLPLVYRTCRRELHSEPLAEDAAQVVFLLLARNAQKLRERQSLAGWLYQTAVFVSKNARKQEARHLRKEEAVMQEILSQQAAPDPEWNTVEPLLNSALNALKSADRDAVLLRFLEGYTLAETGTLLGVSEDAARMRVSRALEKMRRYLTAHGTAMTGVALAALLTGEAARPVSAQSTFAVMQGTLQALANSPAPNILLLSKGVSHTMKIIKIKYAALAAALLIGGASVPPLVHAFGPHKAGRIVRQISPQPTLTDFYTNRQPPIIGTLFLSDALKGQSGMAGGAPQGDGNLQVVTYTSPSSFQAVCQFYTDKLLPPGAKPQTLGVEGDLRKQSGYSIEERQGVSAATFSQRTSTYTILVSINRGSLDKITAVTLVYGLN